MKEISQKWRLKYSLFFLLTLCGSIGLNAQCTTYSILSTGFNRSTQLPYPISGSNGGQDGYWNVYSRQSLNSSFVPTGGITYPAAAAYVVAPYAASGWNSPTIGNARHINMNSSWASGPGAVQSTPNIITYRTFFNLPNPLPANNTFSLSFALRADDGIWQINVNNVVIKAPGIYNSIGGGAYVHEGPPMYQSVYSFTAPGAFLAGSNYIDITVVDMALPANFMEADIILYSCNATAPPGGPPGNLGSNPQTCGQCISSFAPIPGKKYLVSAWTKEKNAVQSKTSYTFPSIEISFPSIGGNGGSFSPSGTIIDGWQRIEGEFVVPSNATNIALKLHCSGSNDCYYDDVRVLPFDGSMKSYVYDPVNLRLVAELDERNYSTLYEYDEEGKLIRVKKETEKGKMTIKENRDNTKK